jgi:hypothetical protein
MNRKGWSGPWDGLIGLARRCLVQTYALMHPGMDVYKQRGLEVNRIALAVEESSAHVCTDPRDRKRIAWRRTSTKITLKRSRSSGGFLPWLIAKLIVRLRG